jgi:nicotinamidase-related amidase
MKEALLLVDIQMDYFAPNGKFPLEDAEASVTAAQQITEHFRKNGAPIFHIKHEGQEGVPFLEKGTPGTVFHPRIAPIEGETVISKQTPNSFFKTDLDAQLRALGVNKITVIGFMANMCVDATTRAGRELGYSVEIVPEAVAACVIGDIPAKTVKAVFLGALNGFIASVVPLEKKMA